MTWLQQCYMLIGTGYVAGNSTRCCCYWQSMLCKLRRRQMAFSCCWTPQSLNPEAAWDCCLANKSDVHHTLWGLAMLCWILAIFITSNTLWRCHPSKTQDLTLCTHTEFAFLSIHIKSSHQCHDCRQARGWAHAMWAVMTFGLGYFVPVAMDTNHFCPQCGKHVAVAKLMWVLNRAKCYWWSQLKQEWKQQSFAQVYHISSSCSDIVYKMQQTTLRALLVSVVLHHRTNMHKIKLNIAEFASTSLDLPLLVLLSRDSRAAQTHFCCGRLLLITVNIGLGRVMPQYVTTRIRWQQWHRNCSWLTLQSQQIAPEYHACKAKHVLPLCAS